MSSRTTYPHFIPLHENLGLQITWALRGVYDAFRVNTIISAVASDAEIRANLFKSLLLNTLSLTSIYVFDLLLYPLVKDQQRWFHRNIGWFYQVLWLLPVVGASFYLNMSWCNVIAKRTYILHYGARAVVQPPRNYTNFLTQMATSAYRAVMIVTSVIVSYGLKNIPYVGTTAELIFLCWVNAYYCFEFVWISRGLSFARRIRHLEERWAYYFAFGLPSAFICMGGTGLANAAIFALVFPLYIILAMHARPMPIDPYNPTGSTDKDTIRHPSPFIPIRVPIFKVVTWLNDLIVKVLDIIFPPLDSHKRNRSRAVSDLVEGVEEGSGSESNTTHTRNFPYITRPVQGRVNISRRKLD